MRAASRRSASSGTPLPPREWPTFPLPSNHALLQRVDRRGVAHGGVRRERAKAGAQRVGARGDRSGKLVCVALLVAV